MNRPAVLGALLGGGSSRRFGRPKAWLSIDGQPFWRRVADTLGTICPALAAAGWPADVAPPEDAVYSTGAIPILPDPLPNRGPVMGLLAALAEADIRGCRAIVVCPVDMPWVPAALLEALLDRLLTTEAFGCLAEPEESPGVPRVQPLVGAYAVQARASFEIAVREPTSRPVIAYLDDARLLRVAQAELDTIHPDLRVGARGLANVNTPADFERLVGPLRPPPGAPQ